MSEAVTRSVRVTVESEFSPERSSPAQNRWFFLYSIRIVNEGRETVTLLSRHWIITDAVGASKEVRGPGVVGQQPVLDPGESFEYTSGCTLPTPYGSMRGTYQMVNDRQEKFEVEIPMFALAEPFANGMTVH
jgi:ApaG protein